MIYLHPASSTSPERILAVQTATGMRAVIDADGKAVLQPIIFVSSQEAPLPTAPGTIPADDTAPGAAGVFSIHKPGENDA